jgi:hypothetical protein
LALQRHGNVVQTFEQATLANLLDLEAERLSPGGGVTA